MTDEDAGDTDQNHHQALVATGCLQELDAKGSRHKSACKGDGPRSVHSHHSRQIRPEQERSHTVGHHDQQDLSKVGVKILSIAKEGKRQADLWIVEERWMIRWRSCRPWDLCDRTIRLDDSQCRLRGWKRASHQTRAGCRYNLYHAWRGSYSYYQSSNAPRLQRQVRNQITHACQWKVLRWDLDCANVNGKKKDGR